MSSEEAMTSQKVVVERLLVDLIVVKRSDCW